MTSALERRQTALVYLGIVVLSLYVGTTVARGQEELSKPLLALVGLMGLVLLTSVPPNVLFASWLFVAPLFQSAADLSSLGRALTWALYIAPALLMLVLTFVRREREHGVPMRLVDWLPAAYVGYVVASILLTTDDLESNPTGTGKAIFIIVGLGPVVYYFLTLGPGARIAPPLILGTVMAAGLVQGFFGLVEYATGWNLWSFTGWQRTVGGGRVVATLANPGVLGAFLGVAIVTAVAALIWRGPPRLRQLAWATIALCTPALLLTLTRGPILATLAVVVLLLVLGRARVLGVAVLLFSGLLLALLLPSLQNTETYKARVAQKATVELRVGIQDISLRLAEEKPVLGWGYGSFDRVKNASQISVEGIPVRSILETTSHNSYLTILVELGVIGLLLYATLFVVLGYRALRSRSRGPDRWILIASVGSLAVIAISASTLDFRFFSFVLMLPYVFLALLRRSTEATRGDETAPST